MMNFPTKVVLIFSGDSFVMNKFSINHENEPRCWKSSLNFRMNPLIRVSSYGDRQEMSSFISFTRWCLWLSDSFSLWNISWRWMKNLKKTQNEHKESVLSLSKTQPMLSFRISSSEVHWEKSPKYCITEGQLNGVKDSSRELSLTMETESFPFNRGFMVASQRWLHGGFIGLRHTLKTCALCSPWGEAGGVKQCPIHSLLKSHGRKTCFMAASCLQGSLKASWISNHKNHKTSWNFKETSWRLQTSPLNRKQ